MTTTLTLTHLRFVVTARTPIRLGGYQAGERLRDALARVMLRAVCPEAQRRGLPTPEHAAGCPVCWLLAASGKDGEARGEVRRVYSLAPPLPPVEIVDAGQDFSFVMTLYGRGMQFFPYFVLAVPEMGREGVGPGRGEFDLRSIRSIDPMAGSETKATGEIVLAEGERVVRAPEKVIGWQDALKVSQGFLAMLDDKAVLEVRFLTPMRLVDGEALVKTPDFGVFFQRLLQRIDQLGQQHASDERRPKEEIERLHRLADQVRLVETDTQWIDLWGPSSRRGRATPMGGFVGRATYRSRDWSALLPWLVLGQGVQAGKLAAKGNGVFQIEAPGLRNYWL
jgi:hypothetical protein